MKKNFTLMGKRIALAIIAIIAFAANASAGSTFYAYYSKIIANPTGKGQIYVSDDIQAEPQATDFKDEVEYKAVSTSSSVYVFAQPAEGYQFAGISQAKAKYNEIGTFVGYEYSDSVVATNLTDGLSLPSDITDNPDGTGNSDSLTVAGMMPLDPNSQFYVNFTKVTVKSNQEAIGTAKISKLCNDKGDEITLTAVPGEGSTFAGWTLNGKTVSTELEYKLTVGDDIAEYTANFDNPNLITLHFDEYGSYIPWYDDANDLLFMDGVSCFYFTPDSTVIAGKNGESSYNEPSYGTFQASAMSARILYGFGDCKSLKVANEYAFADETDINRWSGEKGVKTDTLATGYAYYSVDMANSQMTLATEIAAQQVYIAMPDSVYKNAGLSAAPSIIYTSQWVVPEGIETVKAINVPGMGKVYAIDGTQVTEPKENGLYIINRKKVIYKK